MSWPFEPVRGRVVTSTGARPVRTSCGGSNARADVYVGATDEDASYQLLMERVETVIAEEQQLLWQTLAPQQAPKPEGETE